ncbi:MAG: hypothetical protein ACK5O2_09670 [Microthrixaceae bacterium]
MSGARRRNLHSGGMSARRRIAIGALASILVVTFAGPGPVSAAPRDGESEAGNIATNIGTALTGGFDTSFPSCSSCSGQLNIWLYNQTDSPVTFTFGTEQRWSCAGNTFRNTRGSSQSGTSPPLAPNQFGAVAMTTGTCAGPGGATIDPKSGMGSFTLGQLGSAQFKFGVSWSAGSNFENFEWKGDYTGDGDTGGVYMYNCGSESLLGAGDPGGGDDYNFDNGTYACFVVQDGAFSPDVPPTPS